MDKMERNMLESDRERIAKLEMGFGQLVDEVRSVAKSVKELSYMIQSRDRPNWQIWIGCLGIILTLVGAGMIYVNSQITSSISPIQSKISGLESIRNVQWAGQHRLNEILWNSTPLAGVTKYPEGPYYYINSD
jgi:hypothetical protein